jgi:hypothetical protein
MLALAKLLGDLFERMGQRSSGNCSPGAAGPSLKLVDPHQPVIEAFSRSA